MRRALALVALWAAGAAHAGPMYKCVDAKGVTHYSEKPVPGCRGAEIDLQPLPAPSGAERPESRDLAEQERGFRRRQLERDEAERKAAADMQQRARRCQQLQGELARYTQAGRVWQTDAKGERTIMDDAERERRTASLRAEIGKSCR